MHLLRFRSKRLLRMALGSQGNVFPSTSTIFKESASMSMVSRLLRKQPAPDSSGVAKAHPIPPYDDSSLWVVFVLGSLLSLLSLGLLLRMLILPR